MFTISTSYLPNIYDMKFTIFTNYINIHVISFVLSPLRYVGTRNLQLPEVIHSTSGDVNPISLQEYTDILNDRVRIHPSLKTVWTPHAKIRNGLRHTIFFYIFHIFPTMLWYWPEKWLGLGIRHHTCVFIILYISKIIP